MSEDSGNHSSAAGMSRVSATKRGDCAPHLEQSCCSIQSLGEAGGVYLADYADLVQLFSIATEEQDGGRAEQLVAVQQAALGGIALGDIEAD